MSKSKVKARAKGTTKLPAAVALGKRGGAKGGPARAQVLSSERKKEIARLGGKARAATKGK